MPTKILGIGRNYVKHVKELGNVIPSTPVIFMKPPSSLITNGQSIIIPPKCQNLHHEIELGVIIGEKASKIAKKDAMDIIKGYCVALDMTARDFQDDAKSKQLPWAIAKGFDTSCPVGDFIDKSLIKDPQDVNLELEINGEIRQKGKTDCMIFDIPTLLEYTSQFFTLYPGDLILTGTPEGVSQVKSGDTLISKLFLDDGSLSVQMTNTVQ